MKQYIYAHSAGEQPEGERIYLCSDDRLKDGVVSRASLQKLLLTPEADEALEKRFEHAQTMLWAEQFAACAERDTVVRLPDMLFDCLLPQNEAEFRCVAALFHCEEQALRDEAERLTARHRLSCCEQYRFAPQYVRLFELQIRSIIKGAEQSGMQKISLLLPYSGNWEEVRLLCALTDGIAAESVITCPLGLEITTPRAACVTKEYVATMDFLVFDTEALTQTMYGIAARDAEDAIDHYMREGLFEHSPFCSFDQTGLGTLLLLAIRGARAIKPTAGIGLKGKPAHEPVGLAFCRENKVDMLFTDRAVELTG